MGLAVTLVTLSVTISITRPISVIVAISFAIITISITTMSVTRLTITAIRPVTIVTWRSISIGISIRIGISISISISIGIWVGAWLGVRFNSHEDSSPTEQGKQEDNLGLHFDLAAEESSLCGEGSLQAVLDFREFAVFWSFASEACSSAQSSVYLYISFTRRRHECVVSIKTSLVGLPNYCIHEHNSQVLCTCSTCYTSALNEGWAMFVVSTLMSKSQQVEGLGWGGVNGDPFIDSWKYTHYQRTDRKSLHHTGKSACVHVSSFTWELKLQCSD